MIIRIATLLLLVHGMALAGSGGPGIDVGDGTETGPRGGNAVVSLDYIGSANIATFDFRIGYDPNVFDETAIAIDCSLPFLGLQIIVCTVNTIANEIRGIAVPSFPPEVLQDNPGFATITLPILPDAALGPSTLAITAGFFDGAGNDLGVDNSTDGTVTVGPALATYTVGGNVTGLIGSGLVLQNNGGDDLGIAADGSFTFATPLDDGSGYVVTVLTHPTNLSQTCAVTNDNGTLAGADVTNVAVVCVTNTFTVGGDVSGLAGSGLVLQNNVGDDFVVAADGGFAFATPLDDGSDYNVTVLTQPTNLSQTCAVTNDSGTLAGVNVTNVAVTCVTDTFTVSGIVAGLAKGKNAILQNNNGDDLEVTSNGGFTFTTPLSDGSTYDVTVVPPPTCPSATCTISNGSGTLSGANVSDVRIVLGDEMFADGYEDPNNAITIVDDPENLVGGKTSIAIGSDGFPVISYYDQTADALKVAKCNDVKCSGNDETISTVDDPANNVGQNTSITIGTDGFPIISYFDVTALSLKVAKCNDPACVPGGETITTVDAGGGKSSIAIATNGFPIIGYFDVANGLLKVMVCNDDACTGGNEMITIIDNPNGSDPSLAIGSDGFPVISYDDDSNLKVIKCNDTGFSEHDSSLHLATFNVPAFPSQ